MRRRYVYTQGGAPLPMPLEVGEDWAPPDAERMPLYTDRFMEGQTAQDGTDIGSRRKRADYMKANNLADASDFTRHWQKSAQERAPEAVARSQQTQRTEALSRAYHALKRKP